MAISQWLGIGGGAGDVLPLAILLTLAGGAVLIWGAWPSGALPERRLALMHEGTGLSRRREAGYTTDWKEESAGWYAKGLSHEERWQIVRSFAKIHVPPSLSVAVFAAIRLILAIGGGAIAFSASPANPPVLGLVLGAATSIAGYLLPIMAIDFQLKRHRKSVGSGLPNALELLAVCVGAGLSLESAFQRVATEIKMSSPALSDEFALTWAEISISPSREQALANFAERVNLPAVRSVISTLSQSLRFGTPLAQSLRNAASEMRNQQMIEMEERANGLPALLTIPVMLLIMPAMFMIVGGPAALKLMDMFAK
ncbi:MAG: type II secretion system F family protein [Rhodomicrobium sp.]